MALSLGTPWRGQARQAMSLHGLYAGCALQMGRGNKVKLSGLGIGVGLHRAHWLLQQAPMNKDYLHGKSERIFAIPQITGLMRYCQSLFVGRR